MTDPVIAARHAFLCERIRSHNQAYYVLNHPEISDREYDALVQELRELETAAPELVTPASPTQQVGAPLPEVTRFEKVTRAVPMLSLDNLYDPEDLRKFEKTLRTFLRESDEKNDVFKGELGYLVEPKIDGISIECVYEQGRLKRAVTRGDGVTGENVTANVLAIGRVPGTLSEPLDITVRGEIFLNYSDFRTLNDRRLAEGLEPLVNPRNAVGGAIHQLELQKKAVKAARQMSLFDAEVPVEDKKNPISDMNLSAVFYEVPSDHLRSTQRENLLFLEKLGFSVPAEPTEVASVEEILEVIERWDRRRAGLDFPMDGLVIKVNRTELWKLLGRTAKSPRWAVAFKFEAERALTRLISVDAQVGRTGIITPVANVEPVFVGGTTVARASLHNWAFIRVRKLRIGDMVFIEKKGEIIPQIVGVDGTRPRGESIVAPPASCPSCASELVRDPLEISRPKLNELRKRMKDEFPSVPGDAGDIELEEAATTGELKEAFLTCPNEEGCKAQITERIIHFVSRNALNIDQLGEMIVTRLVEAGFIRSPFDLYGLREDQLLTIEGFAGKSVGQLLAAIQKSRETTLARFIFAIGINGVGAVNARFLAGHFATLEKFVDFAKAERTAREQEVKNISGIGDKLQAEIVEYFERAWVVRMLEDFRGLGLVFSEKGSGQKPLLGKVFCITGKLGKHRTEYVARIQELGGVTRVSPTQKCDYFVTGEKPTPKKVVEYERLINEKKSDIRRLGEVELVRLLEGEEI